MINSNFGSFALPTNLNYDVKTLVKQVKTKKWVKTHQKALVKWQCRLTNEVRDNRQILGGMLRAAFGANIGQQVEEKLTDEDLKKIRLNIIFLG